MINSKGIIEDIKELLVYLASNINDSYLLNEQFGIFLILYCGVGPALISYILWLKSIKIIGANKAGLFLNLIPIFSSFISILFLNETLEFYHIIGAILIFIGIYLVLKKNVNEQN